MLEAGEVLAGRYRLLRRIGAGGMGAVWAAHHELIDRDVAVKISEGRVAQQADVRDRFLNEARAVGRLRHPNVVDVVDFGDLPDGSLYIVFELLQGRSLELHLEQAGRMTSFDAVTVAIEICRGLEAAHAIGVVHRDLKPANIFLHESPTGGTLIKILDFGISKSYDADGVSLSMTQTGVVLGTPQYMSVEQARGLDDIDLRTDIWGVGVLLYEMLTGHQPFEASNYNALLARIISAEPIPATHWGVTMPEGLGAILTQCLRKARDQRYSSARDLRAALEEVQANLPVEEASLNIDRISGFLPVTRATQPSLPESRIEPVAPPARPGHAAWPEPARATLATPARGAAAASSTGRSAPSGSRGSTSNAPSRRSPSSAPPLSRPASGHPALRRSFGRVRLWRPVAAGAALALVAIGATLLVLRSHPAASARTVHPAAHVGSASEPAPAAPADSVVVIPLLPAVVGSARQPPGAPSAQFSPPVPLDTLGGPGRPPASGSGAKPASEADRAGTTESGKGRGAARHAAARSGGATPPRPVTHVDNAGF